MRSSEFILFLGPIYDKQKLNALRTFSNFYLHGHTVGGTNPSLLEALACRCKILAHDNPFNKDVLKNNGYYWSDAETLGRMLLKASNLEFDEGRQLKYLKKNYSWEQVALDHLKAFSNFIK